MKAQPLKRDGNSYTPCPAGEATHLKLNMPGPFDFRILPVILRGPRDGTHCWSWNGDTEKPTLKPSIRTKNREHVCHTFINDGQVQFLADCTHELAGQTLPLLDIEE
ncbi:MAG TPA: DUF6527 family protein [Sedimentisphaerales bacterium]|nr:DUF6527 family protein [Sedimentisphaerales bacterium]